MQLDMQLRFCRLVLVSLLSLAQPAFAQLDRTLEAHGGLQKWRGFAGVEYDLSGRFGKGRSKIISSLICKPVRD